MPEIPNSQSPRVKKLAIKPETRMTVINPIDGFRELLGELPQGTSYIDPLEGEFDWITAFVKSETELDGLIESIKKHLKAGCILWVAIPRAKNPKFNRSTLIASQGRYGLETVSNVVINDDWTAYRYKKV